MPTGTNRLMVAGMLALLLLSGGAGVVFPRLHLIVQVAAIIVAGYLAVTPQPWRLPTLSVVALCLAGAVVLLPLLQLVPLPPAIWGQLPGRASAVELDALLGQPQWRPWTLDVEGTVRSMVVLLPVLILFLGLLVLSRADRVRLWWVVVAVAVASAVLGIAQQATVGSFTPYQSSHSGYPLGLFVNRNHQAAMMLVAMPIASALARIQMARGVPSTTCVLAALSAMVIFGVVTIGTTSRMALLLLPIATIVSLALLFYRRTRLSTVSLALAVLAGVAFVILTAGRLDPVISRFTSFREDRFDYWADIQWALDFYGFAGTGFGTFVPVYKSAESLEAVVPQVINHAHNDYLEVLLEGGWPAALVGVAFLAVVVTGLVRSARSAQRVEDVVAMSAAAAGIALLLTVSTVDYPLRMPALAAVLVLCASILLPGREQALHAPNSSERPICASDRTTKLSRRWRVYIAVPSLAVLLVVVLQVGISKHSLLEGREEAAIIWAPWSTQAHERLATKSLLANDFDTAMYHAHAAISLSPISVPALRTVGLVDLARGAVSRGNAMMGAAVELGWRDPLTQLWAVEAAKRTNEPEKAVQRAEALFRQDRLVAPTIAELLSSADAKLLQILSDKLSQGPKWRASFFKASGELSVETAGSWIRLTELLEDTGSPVSLAEGRPMLDRLVATQRVDDAQKLWALLLSGEALLGNGGFEEREERSGVLYPTYWEIPRPNRAFVRVEPLGARGSNHGLRMTGANGDKLASQMLMLRPGTFRLTIRARSGSPGVQSIVMELRCSGFPQRQAQDVRVFPESHGQWQLISWVAAIPSKSCFRQELLFRRSRHEQLTDLWVDDVTISPVR